MKNFKDKPDSPQNGHNHVYFIIKKQKSRLYCWYLHQSSKNQQNSQYNHSFIYIKLKVSGLQKQALIPKTLYCQPHPNQHSNMNFKWEAGRQLRQKLGLTRFPCLKNKNKEELGPSQEEIIDCLRDLAKQNNWEDLKRIISALHHILIVDQKNKQEFQIILEEKEKHQKEKLVVRLDHIQSIKNIQQGKEYQFLERQIAAKALCYRASGIAAWKLEMKNSKLKNRIDETRFRTIQESIATEVFRKIETVIQARSKKPISKTTQEEMRLTFSYMLNCRDRLPAEDCQTFMRITKATFGLQSSVLPLQNVIRLQRRLLDIIRMRLESREASQDESEEQEGGLSLGLENIWCKQMELELLDFYRSEQNLQLIKEYFCQIHPRYKQLFTCENLRKQLYKSIKAAIRKVRHYLGEFQIKHELDRWSERQLKFLLSARFVDLHFILIHLYTKPGCDREESTRTADLIVRHLKMEVDVIEPKKGIQNQGTMSFKRKDRHSEQSRYDEDQEWTQSI